MQGFDKTITALEDAVAARHAEELVAADAGQLEHGGGRRHGDAVGSCDHGIEEGDLGLGLPGLLLGLFNLVLKQSFLFQAVSQLTQGAGHIIGQGQRTWRG